MSLQIPVLKDVNRINHAYLLGLRAAAREDPPGAAYLFGLALDDVRRIAELSFEALSMLALNADRALVRPALSTDELVSLLQAPLPLVGVLANARTAGGLAA